MLAKKVFKYCLRYYYELDLKELKMKYARGFRREITEQLWEKSHLSRS